MSNIKVNPLLAWKQRTERGSYFWLRIMNWLSLTLGRRWSRYILYIIAGYFLLTSSNVRRVARAYLTRCLGRSIYWRDLYCYFLAFASTIHDRIYLLSDCRDQFRIYTFGIEYLHNCTQGAFLFGAHLGSFEVLRVIARHQNSVKVCMAMYPENARQINSILAKINPQVMQDIITLGNIDSVFAIHQKLEAHYMVGILADRTVNTDQYLSIPFLGMPARFPSGPFRMAVMLGYPVYFMTGLYRGGNRYDVHFELLEDFTTKAPAWSTRAEAVSALLNKYVVTLERYCRIAPFNWFNFYDFWNDEYKNMD